MGSKTSIEWTRGADGSPGATWNPIRARLTVLPTTLGQKLKGALGWHCEHVSEGCRNCYSEAMNRRLGTGLDFKPGHRKDVEIFLDEKMLLAPLKWRKPRRIFVNSMTDTFADFVTDDMLDRIFETMEEVNRHTYQVLTKRGARMQRYVTWRYGQRPKEGAKHIWFGVSCEDQPTADERIPFLLNTPAWVRFVSAEPLLGFTTFRHEWLGWKCAIGGHVNSGSACGDCDPCIGAIGKKFLDQIIIGGESGRGARLMDVSWARSIIAQCHATGVACFVKQLGSNPWVTFDGLSSMVPVKDRKGGDPSEWPEDIRIRQMPA